MIIETFTSIHIQRDQCYMMNEWYMICGQYNTTTHNYTWCRGDAVPKHVEHGPGPGPGPGLGPGSSTPDVMVKEVWGSHFQWVQTLLDERWKPNQIQPMRLRSEQQEKLTRLAGINWSSMSNFPPFIPFFIVCPSQSRWMHHHVRSLVRQDWWQWSAWLTQPKCLGALPFTIPWLKPPIDPLADAECFRLFLNPFDDGDGRAWLSGYRFWCLFLSLVIHTIEHVDVGTFGVLSHIRYRGPWTLYLPSTLRMMKWW